MSQQYQQNRTPGGGGSVKRARERVQAGLPQDMSRIPQPQQTYDPSRVAPSSRTKRPMPQALATTRAAQGPIGVAISRPTQVPQWPLSGTIEGSDNSSNEQYQPPAGRGPAPQRPPRPSHVPSMLDASRLQEHTPSFQYKPQQNLSEQNQNQWRGVATTDDFDLRSPDLMSPATQSSRHSTVSSVGSIPDFPVPIIGPPRRSAHLGPPPSSRRGASSYYSQASFVSPIPEESPRSRTTHRSYASSAAIPSTWGSEYEYEDETPDETYERDGYEHDIIDERGESRGSNNDDGDERGLIRSASIGKRAKPSMIMNKSSESSEQVRPAVTPIQSSKTERVGAFNFPMQKSTTDAKANEGQRDTMWPVGEGSSTSSERDITVPVRAVNSSVWPTIGNVSSPLAGGTGLIDASTSSSEATVPTIASTPQFFEDVSPMSNSPDPEEKAREILGAYRRASMLQPSGAPVSRTSSPSAFSRLSAMRRPPKLDINAVRDAEARGSLTSLPDLILRATRLASMMDRGKRPGSRLNDLNDFPMDEKAFERDFGSPDEKRRSGLSGMLAAFPPPGIATPRDNSRPPSVWPEVDMGNNQGNSKAPKKQRRCCGLPCWGFMIIIVILLIIIAAAIVVPLQLLVFNKPNAPAAPLTPQQQCEANTATACQNGGATLLDKGACACVCTNGFTGATCSISGATGCATTIVGGLNGTIGESVPRLIAAAQSNFSIPLNPGILLARFNTANLSCTSENALITFEGQSQRRGNADDEISLVTSSASATPTQTGQNNRRQVAPTESPSAAVTNGIIFDSQTAPTPVPSSTTTASTPDATSNFVATQEILDFARVAVLYVMQEKQLDSAVNAQTFIQAFLDTTAFTNRAAMNVSIGNGNTINLIGLSLDLADGKGLIGSNTTTATTTPRRSVRRKNRVLWGSVFR
ncbi:hypothetical protein GLAREA_12056 [Glarea lozoyensis ATCC 20868]|uniref:EGF-like domain-containing protein n=1 Tax=Glarea lozoyensis (strain ATCC 20868 / MF5171) TaxID=1116229 RepID=S3D4C7_GLAL2|nr:uncharacterized protein GLAREA_12056 [Glarea lozoyensis ATCC 20868]EPE31974.1 hypothetical protein GLAREA_12056 [Glarea lozoyensis ATCC 20868]